MNDRALDESEREALGCVLNDLKLLFSKEELPLGEVDTLLTELESTEAKSYIKSLRAGSKPEAALRESFFAGNSVLSRYFFGEKAPEVRAEKLGYIDYVIGESTRFILLEIKTLFEASDKGLKQTRLRSEQHRDQITRYFQTGARFAILTNLKDWYFFNDLVRPKDFKPFSSCGLAEFLKDYEMTTDLWNVLERKEEAVAGQDLDKKFFESLASWVNQLKRVKFTVDDKRKIELIIALINKFIFIQTLDAYWVIDFRRIKTSWEEAERKWQAKGRLTFLMEFFADIDRWFYAYYDTELFRTHILDYIGKDDENVKTFYESLQLVLGLAYWQAIFGEYRGIMQYNFKLVNEDVFGKAYETFLAEVRHDEGIYYTPSYISEYIVENTVGPVFDSILDQIKSAGEHEDFDELTKLAREFTSVRVLDPACGSGSFLVKAVRLIWKEYAAANDILRSLQQRMEQKYTKYQSEKLPEMLGPLHEMESKAQKLREIKSIFRSENPRELIARILVRHIHANDLDPKALEVAKVNLWLESVKLAPSEFNAQRLPQETNRILPDLEMNISNGDAVVGLPFDRAVRLLAEKHEAQLKELKNLREEYLEDPTKSHLVERIVLIKNLLRESLSNEFGAFLRELKLPENIVKVTTPLHWPLEFWFLYFEDGRYLGEASGVHALVGNPPFERIQVMQRKSPEYVDYLSNFGFVSASKGNYDLAVVFIERGYFLLRSGGAFGNIATNKFMFSEYGQPLRKHISDNKACREIVDFGDQQVFEDATTYTALIFLCKGQSSESKQALISKLERSTQQLEKVKKNRQLEEPSISVVTSASASLTEEPWSFILPAERSIFDKLSDLPKLGDKNMGKIFVGLQTSRDDIYILDHVRDMPGGKELACRLDGKIYTLEDDLLRPLVSGTDVKRYETPHRRQFVIFPYQIRDNKANLIPIDEIREKYPSTYAYLMSHKKVLESREGGVGKGANWHGYIYLKNMDKQSLPKLCVPRLVRRIQCFYDAGGEFYLDNVDVGGVILGDKAEGRYWFVCALLNSALMSLYLGRKSTKFRGGWLSCNKQYLSKLPIRMPEDGSMTKRIEGLALHIVGLKQKQHVIAAHWEELTEKLKDGERTLLALLQGDLDNIKNGRLEACWTKSASFYRGEKGGLLDAPFVDFRVQGGEQGSDLTILGSDENGAEEEIYSAAFQNRRLMLHIYHCVSALLKSRAKVSSLRNLLEKTVVPLIQLSPSTTTNVIAKLEQDLGKDESDIARIDAQITGLEAEIDAEVFHIYRLNRREVKTVLNTLGFSPLYEEIVLRHFTTREQHI